MKADDHWWIQGCARFPEFLQNFSEHQILWSLCSIVFLALTLILPIQTSLSVAPKLPVSLSSGEKSEKFMKTSTPQGVALGKHALLLCSISFIFMQFSAKRLPNNKVLPQTQDWRPPSGKLWIHH